MDGVSHKIIIVIDGLFNVHDNVITNQPITQPKQLCTTECNCNLVKVTILLYLQLRQNSSSILKYLLSSGIAAIRHGTETVQK